MFCTNCGKKIDDGLDTCPYCNTEIEKESEESYSVQANQPEYSAYQKSQMPMDNHLKKFSFLKYLLLPFITFGIYSIVLLYRFNKTVNTLCEGDDRKSMNYILVLLLGLCTFGVYPLIWIHKQGQRLYEIAPRYNCELKETGTTFLLWNTFGTIIVVGPYIAWYQMFRNINLLIENYNQGNVKPGYNIVKKESTAKTVLIIIGYYALIMLPVFLILLFTFSMSDAAFGSSEEITEELIWDPPEEESQEEATSFEEGESNNEAYGAGESEDAFEYTDLEYLLLHPGMCDKQNVKVYGRFNVDGDRIYIPSQQGTLDIVYNGSTYDESGNVIGKLLNRDQGYVNGIYNAAEEAIYASRIVLTDDIPEKSYDSDAEEAVEPDLQENIFIGTKGSYIDFTYGGDSSSKSVQISNITDSSFDFVIYDGNDVIFRPHTAVIDDFDRGTYYGQQYTVFFFWNSSTELVVQGFDEVGGLTFINTEYLHTS